MHTKFDQMEIAISALRQAQTHIEKNIENHDIEWVGREPKIALDAELDALIRRVLAVTQLPVLSEEQDVWPEWYGQDPIWIVDPLDGSFNFVRGTGPCAVSIALWHGTSAVLGAILDIRSGEIAWGASDGPAMQSARIISCSNTTERSAAVICTGIPSGFDFSDPDQVSSLTGIMASYGKVRMIGSAASSLVMVASGQADAYSEQNIKIWDVAAGMALVRAAGGRVRMEVPNASQISVNVDADNGQLPLL